MAHLKRLTATLAHLQSVPGESDRQQHPGMVGGEETEGNNMPASNIIAKLHYGKEEIILLRFMKAASETLGTRPTRRWYSTVAFEYPVGQANSPTPRILSVWTFWGFWERLVDSSTAVISATNHKMAQ